MKQLSDRCDILMSPNTGEYIINSPRKPPRKLFLLKSVRGVILMVKKRGEKKESRKRQ